MASAEESESSSEFYLCDIMSDGFPCDENTTIPLPGFDSFKAFKVSALALMIVLSTVGNGVAIAVTCKIRGRRKSTVTTLVLNLAMADLLVTYCHMLFHAVWYSTDAWLGGEALCKIAKFFSSFGLFASSFITVDVALDRCLAVLRPLGQRQRPFLIKILILNSYFLAALFSVPQLIIFRLEHWPYDPSIDYWQCVSASYLPLLYAPIYTTLVLLVQFLFPLLIMFVAYGLIFLKIRQKVVMKETSENLSEMRQARSKLFLRAQRRTVRMALAIFTVFAINWFPYVLFSMWYLWFPAAAALISERVFEVAFLFALSNSCFNPVIYGACNARHFHRICACLGLRPSAGKSGMDTSQTEGRSNNKTTMYSVRWQSSKAAAAAANNNGSSSATRMASRGAKDGKAGLPSERQQMITTTT